MYSGCICSIMFILNPIIWVFFWQMDGHSSKEDFAFLQQIHDSMATSGYRMKTRDIRDIREKGKELEPHFLDSFLVKCLMVAVCLCVYSPFCFSTNKILAFRLPHVFCRHTLYIEHVLKSVNTDKTPEIRISKIAPSGGLTNGFLWLENTGLSASTQWQCCGSIAGAAV